MDEAQIALQMLECIFNWTFHNFLSSREESSLVFYLIWLVGCGFSHASLLNALATKVYDLLEYVLRVSPLCRVSYFCCNVFVKFFIARLWLF